MKRRPCPLRLPLILLTLIPCHSWGNPSPANSTKPPNILFVMADDHAREAVGAYGSWLSPYVKTPTLDRLAAEGMRFTRFACNNSICSPSRATFLTGQYSHRHGVRHLNGTIHKEAPWISEALQRGGYQTAVFGKWHLRSRPRGFDQFKVTRGQGRWFNPTFFTPSSEWYTEQGKRTEGMERHAGYSSDVYTDQALHWLKARDRSAPFCLMLHFKAPHHSFEYPQRLGSLHEQTFIPEPMTLHEHTPASSPRLKAPHRWGMDRNYSYYERHKEDESPGMGVGDTSDSGRRSAAYQHLIHKYLRAVAAIDENVARVIESLRAEDVEDDTLVIYTSDQGYFLGQHSLYDKRLMLEESLLMPLIVRYPKEVPPNSKSSLLCGNVDMAKTILDFAGLPAPPPMQGRSLRPILQGQTPDDWRKALWYAYWVEGAAHWGVRTSRYKLVLFPPGDVGEFYDLQADPFELSNVFESPHYGPALQHTRELLERTATEVQFGASDYPTVTAATPSRKRSRFTPKEGPWRSLFDGNSLSGWKRHGGASSFRVENRVLIGTCVKGEPSAYLCTEKPYQDFVLELEFLADPEMNSGVQIRTQIATRDTPFTKPNGKRRTRKAGSVFGYQVEIDPSDRDWSGGIYDQSRRGWLQPVTTSPVVPRIYRDQGWNHFRIECRGPRIQTWLNGIPRADLHDQADARGVIGLQVHGAGRHEDRVGASVRFRNLRIQMLEAKPMSPDPSSSPTEDRELPPSEKTFKGLSRPRTTTGNHPRKATRKTGLHSPAFHQ